MSSLKTTGNYKIQKRNQETGYWEDVAFLERKKITTKRTYFFGLIEREVKAYIETELEVRMVAVARAREMYEKRADYCPCDIMLLEERDLYGAWWSCIWKNNQWL